MELEKVMKSLLEINMMTYKNVYNIHVQLLYTYEKIRETSRSISERNLSRADNNKLVDSYIQQAKKGEQSEIIACTKENSSSAFSETSAIVFNSQAIYILDAGDTYKHLSEFDLLSNWLKMTAAALSGCIIRERAAL